MDTLSQILSMLNISNYKNEIENTIRYSVHLSTTKEDTENRCINKSKLGGFPDLPASLPWPCNKKGVALSFLCQLKISDIPTQHKPNSFPENGFLHFFYDSLNMPSGDNVNDFNGWKVLYSDLPIEQYTKRHPPLEMPNGTFECDEFDLCSIIFSNQLSFPDRAERLPGNIDEEYYYTKLINPEQCIHKIWGYPNTIQEPMEELCNKLLHKHLSTTNQIPKKNQSYKSADWQLLLQIDSDKNSGMHWEDSGRLYFWIRADDMANKDFSKVWVCLQSH